MKAMWVTLCSVFVIGCGGGTSPGESGAPDAHGLDAGPLEVLDAALNDVLDARSVDVLDVAPVDWTMDVDLLDLSVAVQCPVESGEQITKTQCKELDGQPCISGKCGSSWASCNCTWYAKCYTGVWECTGFCDDSCWCGGCPDVGDTVDEVSPDAPDAQDCGVEGEIFGEPAGTPVCCEGLVAVWHAEPDEFGNCGADFMPSAICTACGDQVCGTAENFCSCPMDCPPPECISEGETGPVTPGAPPCCDGAQSTGIAEADPLTGECVPLDGAFLCTDCNDGICSPWENTCICAEDCPETGEDCFGLGEQFNEFDTDLTCCEGLVASPDCLEESGSCSCPNCPCMICLACGDQSCDAFETYCNCPEDCEPEKPCFEAGQLVPVWLPDSNCCEGLTKVQNEEYDPDMGLCTPLVGTSLCTECPNGVCELWETPCTCPDDC